MPAFNFAWFLPGFVLFWMAITGVVSLVGGWHELSNRFRCYEAIDGRRFSFASGAMGWAFFPVNYGTCLFVTVGPTGFALSVLFPFRFLHPQLVIPWSEVERCEQMTRFLSRYVVVQVAGVSRRISLSGKAGTAVFETWAQQQAQR